MAKTTLTPLNPPIGIRNDYIAPEETLLQITQHDRKKGWAGREFKTTKKSDGTLLFIGNDTSMSKTRCCKFKSAKDLPLFELRRKYLVFETTFYLRLPGGEKEDLLIAKTRATWGASRYDVKIRNVMAGGPEDVVIQMEQQGTSTTHVLVGGALVGIVRRDPSGSEESHGACSVGYGEEWEVRVAEGMDLALVSCVDLMAVLECMLYRD